MKQWTPTCTEILTRMAKGGYTNAQITAHIQERTGLRFSLYTVSRHRAALSLPRCPPAGLCRALRRWRTIYQLAA